MHKRLFSEAMIKLTISPDGPILIKAGESGVDPTRPDMEFVRTLHEGRETIYLPGSSLKGVLRAHCERIARTVDNEERRERHHHLVGLPEQRALSCNPLKDKIEVDKRGKSSEEIKAEEEQQRLEWACSQWLGAENKRRSDERRPPLKTAEVYRWSCFVCQIFGNTSLASHLRLTDGYPLGAVKTEERNGVAIDRVFGSVAVGPFNYEVCTKGDFQTTLYLKNFTLAQLGLLALALRDLEAGRVGLGFAKSRGLGRVKARLDSVVLRYPLCQIEDGTLRLLGREQALSSIGDLLGVGAFLDVLASAERTEYGYPASDRVRLVQGMAWGEGELGEAELKLTEGEQIKALWRTCVPKWGEVLKA